MDIPSQIIDQGVNFSRVDNSVNTRIDKITIILPVSNKVFSNGKSKQGYVLQAINDMWNTDRYLIIRASRLGRRYIRGLTLKLKDNINCYIYVECQPISKHSEFMRLELSPQHWNINQLNEALVFIFNSINKRSISLLRKAYISRVDFAIDIDGHVMSDVIVDYDGVRNGHITTTTSFGGLKLGSNTSRICLSVYEKFTFIGEQEPEKVTPKMLRVKDTDVHPFTRFEIRFSPEKNEVPLSELKAIENLASGLHLYDRKAVLSRSRTHVGFKQGIQSMPLPEVWKAYYADTSRKGRERKQKMMNILASNEWNFGQIKIWKCWPECVSKLGLLSQPDLWNEC